MNLDDPKLTAYALDELNPAERAEIEQLLRDDPAALAELEETAAFAARLQRELKAEPSAPLTDEQRDEVFAVQHAAPMAHQASTSATEFRRRIAFAAAACLIVGFGLRLLHRGSFPSTEETSDNGGRPLTSATIVVRPTPGTMKIQGSAPLPAELGKSGTATADDRGLYVTARATEATAVGESALRAGDLPRAFEHFKLAVDLLTPSSRSSPQHAQALERFSEVSVKLAESQIAAGQTDAASSTLGLVLDDRYSPRCKDAIILLARLEQPDYYNKTIGPRFRGKIEQTKQYSAEAESFYQSGRYDLALKRTEQALAIDPYNLAARKFQEKINTAIDASGTLAYSDAHSRAVRNVDKAWASPIRRFNLPEAEKPSQVALAEVAERVNQMTKTLNDLSKEKNDLRLERAGAKVPAEGGAAGSGTTPAEPSFGNTEAYDAITDNAFLPVAQQALSTFSIDVDTASYANVRRFLNAQTLPPAGAVRIEELLNYFTYDYPQPEGDAPFSSTMEVAACPWAPEHRLVRIGLKGREIRPDKRPASNLAFLIDVSGSMSDENKLPLVERALQLLVDQLSPEDTVSIAVYAGASGTVLEPTHDRRAISAALDRLQSGGSTNGGAGIQLAYRLAEQSFIKEGVNRVILATDGDFNVGVTSQDELVQLIERKAKSGVFLTVLGFGMGNLKDSTLEKLADKGNGNYAYIDTLQEARKVLVEQMNGTLVTIAKDVKIQVEFNPAQVSAYRLIGYENRLLAKEDFNDDKKDAGEIGAGHTVTALYEIVPAGQRVPGEPSVDPLKYQPKSEVGGRKAEVAATGELLTLKLRYKQPDSDTSKLLEFPLTDRGETWEKSSRDFRFAAAVAGFGMLLRDSPHKGSATWSAVRELALEGKGEDRSGYRAEFVTLIEKARALTPSPVGEISSNREPVENGEKSVTVSGEIRTPGTVRVGAGDRLTVSGAIVKAGGLSAFANSRKVVVFRKVAGATERFVVDVKEIIERGNSAKDMELESGDRITVPRHIVGF